MDYEKLAAQRSELAASPEFWQFDLLTPEKLCQFSRDRAVPVLNADTIKDLWCVGLLRSDLIRSRERLEIPSVEFILEENGFYAYCDKRTVEHRAHGYGGFFGNKPAEFDSVELLFHPFRLYVLYHVDRVFRLHSTSTQYLLNPEGIATVSKHNIDLLNRWTAGKEFAERFEHWNRVAENAIVLEPTAYTAVFHVMRWSYPDTQDTLAAKLQERREKIRSLFSDFSEQDINSIRSELCQQAELLDQNKLIHVLIRLMSQHERLKLRSALGGSMLFLCMAEIIRRAAEDALGQNFPEEDEIGFGQWMAGARKSIYGTERIFDSTRETCRDFLTSMGLDYGVKVRCYVEGETELGAMVSAVGEAGGTEFINLRGQVVEKRGKGLSFAASLKNDKKSHIFSVVVMDQDRDDFIRALKKAAAEESFFGRFFISSPDFEFANFTVDEMIDVLLELEARDNIQIPAKDEIAPLVAQTQSGKQFFESLKKNELLQRVGKSETWGEALMKYALQHPEFPQGHKKAGEIRPAIEVARLLINARDAGYVRSIETYKVDPATGELLKRD
ncbi:MAG: hypothetical protein M0Q52_09960 [Lascolabacillus sp.]|jgi:hypothetical protein|nr:hypothetical protein [Lascolabacillus sp.]